MNVVIKVNDEIKQKMIEYYKDKMRDKVIPYVVFQAEEEDTVITMYESGKVMFQGKSADVDASMWGMMLDNTEEKREAKKKEDTGLVLYKQPESRAAVEWYYSKVTNNRDISQAILENAAK